MERKRLNLNWRRVGHIALVAATVLAVAGLLLSAYGGMFDPRSWGFVPGVMVVMLPAVFMSVLVYTAVLALFRRWRHVCVLGAALLLSLTRMCGVFPLHVVGSTPRNADSTFTVMTYNVESFPHIFTQDTCSVMRTILDIDADVVLMQEVTNCDLPFLYDTVRGLKTYREELDKKFPYRTHTHLDEVGIMSKYPFTVDTIVPAKKGFDSLNYKQDLYHYPAMAYDIVVHGHRVRLISAHLQSYGLSNAEKGDPNGDPAFDVMKGSRVYGMSTTEKLNRAFALRADDAARLRTAIDNSPETVIVCGDFNDVPGSYSYRTVMGDDMSDAWTQCGLGYTHTFNAHHFYFKIDHILYRGPLRAVDARVYTDVPRTYTSSDHYPQVATFEFTK